MAGCCVQGNEPSAPTKREAFLESLWKCQLFKKDSAPWSYVISGMCLMDLNPTCKEK